MVDFCEKRNVFITNWFYQQGGANNYSNKFLAWNRRSAGICEVATSNPMSNLLVNVPPSANAGGIKCNLLFPY